MKPEMNTIFLMQFEANIVAPERLKKTQSEIPKFKHFRKELFWFSLRFYLNRIKN